MRTSDFDFDLPEALIAQFPAVERTASRLLCLDGNSGALSDATFSQLPQQLHAGDLLVFNDTRVIKARLLGRKESGGKVEVLVERVLDSHRALAHVRASKSPKSGTRLILSDAIDAEVLRMLNARANHAHQIGVTARHLQILKRSGLGLGDGN